MSTLLTDSNASVFYHVCIVRWRRIIYKILSLTQIYHAWGVIATSAFFFYIKTALASPPFSCFCTQALCRASWLSFRHAWVVIATCAHFFYLKTLLDPLLFPASACRLFAERPDWASGMLGLLSQLARIFSILRRCLIPSFFLLLHAGSLQSVLTELPACLHHMVSISYWGSSKPVTEKQGKTNAGLLGLRIGFYWVMKVNMRGCLPSRFDLGYS